MLGSKKIYYFKKSSNEEGEDVWCYTNQAAVANSQDLTFEMTFPP